jgi:hypothetical protein
MTIEIQQPELEALIRLPMESDRFTSVEDVLTDALRSFSNSETPPTPERNLVEFCAMVSGLSAGLDSAETNLRDAKSTCLEQRHPAPHQWNSIHPVTIPIA